MSPNWWPPRPSTPRRCCNAVENLDANLAATQLGITISSLALGWIGEPALAHLIEPLFTALPGAWAAASAHIIAVIIAFTIITALHIVLGELAPKSLAIQRSETTALAIVRPLLVFLWILRPAIVGLNAMGNLVLRSFGITPGGAELMLHSPEELKLLVRASREGGLLEKAQQDLVARAINFGSRRVSSIMTPRPELDWVDITDPPEDILKVIRQSRHDQLLVGQGRRAEMIGTIQKKDLLEQVLDGKKLDPVAAMRQPLVIIETTPIVRVLEQFKRSPVRMATIVDEYGVLQGIITQTDLLEAITGDLAGVEGEDPDIVEKSDGSFVFDGLTPAQDAFDKLGLGPVPEGGDYDTIAGFALQVLGQLPEGGETFEHEGWRFEIAKMDGRRVDKLTVRKRQSA